MISDIEVTFSSTTGDSIWNSKTLNNSNPVYCTQHQRQFCSERSSNSRLDWGSRGDFLSWNLLRVLWWSSVTHLLKGQINFCIISGAGLLALLPFNNQALISCHPKCISVQHLYDTEHFLKAVSACRFVHLVVWFRTVLKLKAVSLCVVFFKVNWDVPAICAWLRCNTESITVFLLNYYCQI